MSSLHNRLTLAGTIGLGEPRRTLKSAIACVGRGLHSGVEVSLTLLPAPAGGGIVFHRSDIGMDIPARFDAVSDTRLCTVIESLRHPDVKVSTIEHLMAAVSASEIDDLRIEVNAGELPILDGSASSFLFLIESAGIVAHGGRRDVIKVVRPVHVSTPAGYAQLHPHEPGGGGLDLSLEIEFPASVIGSQSLALHLTPESFATELAAARTFTFASEISALREMGLAKGGSLANAIVVDGEQILNAEGLRWPDEFVRHKMLDVIGDLALAGRPICGRFVGYRTGHAMNNLLLRELFSDAANYRVVSQAPVQPLELAAA